MNVITRTCTCEKRAATHKPHTGLISAANRAHPHNLARLRLLQRRTADRLRALTAPDGDGEPLARIFGHPQGAGFIGPGADGLLRAILTEALTSKVGVSWVIATRHDLDALWGDALDDNLLAKFSSRLHVTETLEDAIERLEFEADIIGALNVNDRPSTASSAVLWFTSPGPHTDVVHQTLQQWPGTNLLALINGGWPHGPTHLVDHDGPRRLPRRPINPLTAHQAANKLRTGELN